MSPAALAPRQSGTAQPNVSFVLPSLGKQSTCQELFIKWFYSGPTGAANDISLFITNEGLRVTSGTGTTSTTSRTVIGTGSSTGITTPPQTSGQSSSILTSGIPSVTTSRTRTGSDIISAPSSTPAGTSTQILTNPVSTGAPDDTGIFTLPEGTGLPTTTSGMMTIMSKRATNDHITVKIASGLTPASGNLTWPDITVPAGLYVIAATFPGSNWTYVQRSLPFTVSSGSDTSCIGSQSTAVLATGTPSPSTTAVGATGSRSNGGKIAGGVIGGLAALAALIAALLFYRYKHRSRSNTGSTSTPSHRRRWNRLGNVDLVPGLGGAAFPRDRKPAVRDYGTDVKSPSAYGFSNLSPRQQEGPQELSSSPTFLRAPPASHDPFLDPPTNGEHSPFADTHGIEFTPAELGYKYTPHTSMAYSVGSSTAHAASDSHTKVAYPSGGSDALPDEDLASMAYQASPSGESPGTSGSRLQRKPVPDYDPTSTMKAGMAGVGSQMGPPGKQAHYLMPDFPAK